MQISLTFNRSQINLENYFSVEKARTNPISSFASIFMTRLHIYFSTKGDFISLYYLSFCLMPFRFIFCRAVLTLFHPAETRESYIPECMPHLPGFVSPDSEAVVSYVRRLADHLKVSNSFIYS